MFMHLQQPKEHLLMYLESDLPSKISCSNQEWEILVH
jgi:hypothetical protein